MERRELRLWKNRQSAERSRRNKDSLITSLQSNLGYCEMRIEDLKDSNDRLRSAAMEMGIPVPESVCRSCPFDSEPSLFLEPAVF